MFGRKRAGGEGDASGQELGQLRAQVMELGAQREVLHRQVEQQQQRIEELEARLSQDSSNSSKPPSSDPPWRTAHGPRLMALIAMLTVPMRVSRRNVQRLLESLCGVHISLGALSGYEGRVSTALMQRKPGTPNGVEWLHVHETAFLE